MLYHVKAQKRLCNKCLTFQFRLSFTRITTKYPEGLGTVNLNDVSGVAQGVQGRQDLVVNIFVLLKIFFFGIVVAIFHLVHDVEAIFYPP